MNNAIGIKASIWTLTEYGQGEHQQRTIDLPGRELVVGRGSDSDITIVQTGISKRHARILFEEDHMVVEDLNSTNGTFVNGNRVQCSSVNVGDLLQFANALYKVGRRGESIAEGTIEEGIAPWAQTLLLFDRLLSERAVVPHFQPIVQMSDQTTAGYELLARSNLEGLPSPALMFGAAERLGQQAALSEMMRLEGMRAANSTGNCNMPIYVNTHPVEVITERMVGSLQEIRNQFPDSAVVVEIHEAAVTQVDAMREFRAVLDDLDMRLSYDDFGAGQGRLMELCEVPPDTLKFDMQLIRGIDTATSSRKDLLRSLVTIATDLGAVPLAEGVETSSEHEVCCEIGFQLGQGFLYGKPLPWETVHAAG